MAYCLLDIFPVELIHQLLNYFSAQEIFHTFADVSSYVNDVLRTYPNYCVNFKSITRKEFEVVCQRIIPDQVVSLTLSNSEETSGQIELFLSHFQINQFTHLRSLTLIEMGPDFWKSIMKKLINLKNLRSFIYDSSARNDPWVSKISEDDITKLDKRLFDSYAPVLPQLNRLKLSHGNFLSSVQFPCLHHLIIRRCKVDIAEDICRVASQLKSLEVTLEYEQPNRGFTFPLTQLNRLVLRIEGSSMSMNNMEQLMATLPNLKYFELNGHGGNDLVDGQRWQMITSQLNTFNFMIRLSANVGIQNLDSFRSPFWLIEKHWYVAYDTSRFMFSIPYFAKTEAELEFQPPALSTAPDLTILHKCITRLTISKSLLEINHRFPEVQTLILSSSIHLLTIDKIVDLNRIQHLILSSITKYDGLLLLINAMPNLRRIFIKGYANCFLEEVVGASFEKIETLEIDRCYSRNLAHAPDHCYSRNLAHAPDHCYDIEQLFSVFPRVKHLHIGHWCSITQMLDILNQFRQLTTASFRFAHPNTRSRDSRKRITQIQSILDHHRSAQKLGYTYRFTTRSVYVWL